MARLESGHQAIPEEPWNAYAAAVGMKIGDTSLSVVDFGWMLAGGFCELMRNLLPVHKDLSVLD